MAPKRFCSKLLAAVVTSSSALPEGGEFNKLGIEADDFRNDNLDMNHQKYNLDYRCRERHIMKNGMIKRIASFQRGCRCSFNRGNSIQKSITFERLSSKSW
ncbi:hypothetical protein L208DRAFT_1400406 [Tricholoma matsutake]|nr:hypothetical protein L208DRAFT_1400406 [Tricholoma matsutake 945]